jgi:[ribosomal protein S18]-alanine N-acetyltransferase
MKRVVLNVRPPRNAAEVQQCAEWLVASEPWVTLQLKRDYAIQRLTDPDNEVHLATVEDHVVGVLVLCLKGVFKGYIATIAVHPDWRARGIGSQMLNFAEERCFAVSPNVFLLVSSFNAGAQRLYQRHGYERVGELPDFVIQGYSEILMRRTRGPLRGSPGAARA